MKCQKCKKQTPKRNPSLYWNKVSKIWECEKCTDYLKKNGNFLPI